MDATELKNKKKDMKMARNVNRMIKEMIKEKWHSLKQKREQRKVRKIRI